MVIAISIAAGLAGSILTALLLARLLRPSPSSKYEPEPEDIEQ